MTKRGILERLKNGPVIGDGSMCFTLERRGYARAGPYTPEAVIMYPDAVRQLLREYVRAGADVVQTPCFYSTDGILESCYKDYKQSFTASDLNEAACRMAKEVASENGNDVLVCGGLTHLRYKNFEQRKSDYARIEFEKQLQPYIDHDVDFVMGEYFHYIDEMEVCIDVMKKAKKPIAAAMRIGPLGDHNGVSVEECAVRMAKAGAHIVGINCCYDINTQLKVIQRMRAALDKEGLSSTYLIMQPIGWHCPEVKKDLNGYMSLPECPLELDARLITRAEAHKFARKAFELGANYIGGCCGIEPHIIRAFAQELALERGKDPPVNEMCPPFAKYLAGTVNKTTRYKASNKDFWMNIVPGTGRPSNPAFSDVEGYKKKVEESDLKI